MRFTKSITITFTIPITCRMDINITITIIIIINSSIHIPTNKIFTSPSTPCKSNNNYNNSTSNYLTNNNNLNHMFAPQLLIVISQSIYFCSYCYGLLSFYSTSFLYVMFTVIAVIVAWRAGGPW